jgi:serine/threonine protein kinase
MKQVFQSPVRFPLGESLGPDLQLLRRLDGGSTADVYLAREAGLQRLVAVKVLRRELCADPVARQRFLREARAAARVSHANVTAVHRIGVLPDGVPYIVMEYVDGRPVEDLLAAAGPLGLHEARILLASIASALAAVHDCGIVHRDVQTGNVYVENRTGRAVLGDFGVAALLESGGPAIELTAVGVRLGHKRSMSPERLRGDAATDRSDIYALGVLAYEVLTGRGPYDAATDVELLAAHVHGVPRPLAALRPDVDPGLARMFEQCLAKDPNRRPRAHDIAHRLTAAGGVGENVGSHSPTSLFLAELKRRKVYQVLVGYGAFAIAVLGAAEVLYEAFDLEQRAYRLLALATLAGFPLALALGWIFDITGSGVRRTEATVASAKAGALKWLALGSITLIVVLVGWLLLKG